MKKCIFWAVICAIMATVGHLVGGCILEGGITNDLIARTPIVFIGTGVGYILGYMDARNEK